MTDNSTSGILGTPQAEVSTAHFEQMTTLSSTYATVITKAKRNGRWWVLKSLGHANMGQRVYEEMLLKEFNILQSLQHPGIVTALDIEQVTGLGAVPRDGMGRWHDPQTMDGTTTLAE